MKIYEKWDGDNTVLINSENTDDEFKISKLIAKGYLLVVDPGSLDHLINKKGGFTFSATERSWKVVPLSQSELDAIASTAAAAAARIAEDSGIAAAILAGDLGDLTYTQLEDAIAGETSLAKKNHRITWALLKERNRNNI